jgi:APA family basic amino acid/polyamine antiporter
MTQPVRPGGGRLLRVLGLGFGLAVIVGNTIGAGILRTPGDIARHLPSTALFLGVWVVGALYALLGANSLAELGAAIPRSGGQYVFAHRALGEYPAFIVGWSDWLSTCGTSAAVAIVIGESLGRIHPPLAPFTLSIALVSILLVTLVQWRSVRWGGRAQELTSLAKAIAFVALVVACFAFGGRADGGGEAAVAVPALAAAVLALQAVIYSFDGWTGPVYFSEEVKDPGREVPRAMFFGLLAVTAIYLLFNLALVHVLPLGDIAHAKLPAGAAAFAVFGPTGDLVVTALTLVTMLSAVNAYQLMAPRVLYAMANDRLALGAAVAVNRGGTPTVALLLSTFVALAFLASGTFSSVIAVLAFFFVANYTISFVSLIALRRREPDLPRPYRCWGYPWTNAIALLGSLAFLAGAVWSDRSNSLWALALLAASYPVFRLARHFAHRAGGPAAPGEPGPA